MKCTAENAAELKIIANNVYIGDCGNDRRSCSSRIPRKTASSSVATSHGPTKRRKSLLRRVARSNRGWIRTHPALIHSAYTIKDGMQYVERMKSKGKWRPYQNDEP